jgi:hypothetical protein
MGALSFSGVSRVPLPLLLVLVLVLLLPSLLLACQVLVVIRVGEEEQ